MLITRRNFAALFVLAFCQIAVTALPVRAEDAKPFITAKELDLTKFLAPPPGRRGPTAGGHASDRPP